MEYYIGMLGAKEVIYLHATKRKERRNKRICTVTANRLKSQNGTLISARVKTGQVGT